MKEKGITLIALVVTIIILLILAGITIGMLVGNNGIINKVKQARDLTREGEIREAIEIAIIENDMYNYKLGTKNTKKSVVEALYKSGKLTESEYNKLLGLNGETEVDVIKIGTTEIDFSGLGTEPEAHSILLGKIAGAWCESVAQQPEAKDKLIIAYNKLKTAILSSNESQAEAITYIGSGEASAGLLKGIASQPEADGIMMSAMETMLNDIKRTTGEKAIALGKIASEYCEAAARQPEAADKMMGLVETALEDIKGTTGEKAIAIGKIAGACCEAISIQPGAEYYIVQAYNVLKEQILSSDESQAKAISYIGSKEVSEGAIVGIAHQPEAHNKVMGAAEIAMSYIEETTGEKAIALGKIAGICCDEISSQPEREDLILQTYEMLKTKILLVDEIQAKEISYMASAEISWGMIKGALIAGTTYVPESCYDIIEFIENEMKDM